MVHSIANTFPKGGLKAQELRPRLRVAVGLISGTSLDGIDAAMLITDGERVVECGPAATFAYPCALPRPAAGHPGDESPTSTWLPLVQELTERHADAVDCTAGREPGWRHRRSTSSASTARPSGIARSGDARCRSATAPSLARALPASAVVDDSRSVDVAAGGQGAPLVPLYHAALAAGLARPVAVLNIGGVANVTWIGEATAGTWPRRLRHRPGQRPARRLDAGQDRAAVRRHGGALAATGTVDGDRVHGLAAPRLLSTAAAEVARPGRVPIRAR